VFDTNLTLAGSRDGSQDTTASVHDWQEKTVNLIRVLRVALYIRVNTTSKPRKGTAVTFVHDPDFQEEVLRGLIARRGWNLYRNYRDDATGGSELPQELNRMLADARGRRFDVIVVWHLDHFMEGLASPSETYLELKKLGIPGI
jgi:hypothetical protein